MTQYLTPGVYIEEVPSGNQPIEGVSTSIVGFLGVAERGPGVATLITSFNQFAQTFGLYYKTDRQYYLAYAVEGFFQNGGQECFVQTVTSSAAKVASQAIGEMDITSVSGGAWGNRVGVKVEQSSNLTGVKVTVMYWSQIPAVNADGKTVTVDPTSRNPNDLRNPARSNPQVIETYDNLDANPLSTSFYGAAINGVSNLISVTQAGPGLPPAHPLTLLTLGTDGAPLVLADFTGVGAVANPPGQKIGLDAFTAISEISLLCCPDAYALPGVDINIQLIDQCELGMNRFAILNSAAQASPPGTLISGYNSEYAAFYYPWINIIDPVTDLTVLIPPCGHIAGIYARTDNQRNVAKAPANAQLLGIDSLQFILTDNDQALLNPIGINALRYFKTAGNLVWGARTTSIDPAWIYINVRRLFIFIEQSILTSTQWAVFEVNDEPTWAQIRRSVSDFLTTLWMEDMLQGATKEEAFFVRCDRTTMTQNDIENGRMICVIGVAPVYPAEFVIFQVGQWAGGSSVSEQ